MQDTKTIVRRWPTVHSTMIIFIHSKINHAVIVNADAKDGTLVMRCSTVYWVITREYMRPCVTSPACACVRVPGHVRASRYKINLT